MFKLIDNETLYLECGMEFKLPLLKKKGQVIREMHLQMTIRDIEINSKHQREGWFSKFIEWLLVEKKIAVCLESIQPKWLKERLFASDHWILQTPEDSKSYCPTYARFPDSVGKKFTLF